MGYERELLYSIYLIKFVDWFMSLGVFKMSNLRFFKYGLVIVNRKLGRYVCMIFIKGRSGVLILV